MGRARWCCEGNAKRTGSLAAFSGAGMPSRRITIRRIKELLRLRYECGLSLERVARAQNLSEGRRGQVCEARCGGGHRMGRDARARRDGVCGATAALGAAARLELRRPRLRVDP